MSKSTTYFEKDFSFLLQNEYLYQLVKNRQLTRVKHNHDFFEIVMVINGNIIQNINGIDIKMQKNDFVILSPNDTHFYKWQSDDAYIFSLSISEFRYIKIVSAIECLPKYSKVYKSSNISLYSNIMSLPLVNLPKQKYLINSILIEFITDAVQNDFLFEKQIPERLQNAIEKMSSKENITFGVKRLAELSGYSVMQLERLTKKYYNKTPFSLLNDLKMKIATEYLKNTSFKIETIAIYVGFSSLSQFHAAFKKYYNITPNEYRKEKLSLVI